MGFNIWPFCRQICIYCPLIVGFTDADQFIMTSLRCFIGRQVVAALLQAGYSVVCGVRKPEPNVFPSLDAVVCDFARDLQPEAWLPRLANIDVVVNCAGILREAKDQSFDAVHRVAPG